MSIKNILETKSTPFYGEVFSPEPKENLTFPISLFLIITANSYAEQCELGGRIQLIMFQLYFLLEF